MDEKMNESDLIFSSTSHGTIEKLGVAEDIL
jgi:hypothetical protein